MPSKRATTPRRAARKIDARSDAATLGHLIPPPAGGTSRRRFHPGSVEFQSHLVRRKGRIRPAAGARRGVIAETAPALPGYAFNVPAPERNRRLLWASISLPWQYWEWDGSEPTNDSSSNERIEGSVSWAWALTGNPSLFPNAPGFTGDSGLFQFYTLIPPGGSGFSAGWLAEPIEKIFSGTEHPKGEPTPLAQLLGVRDGDVLRLWNELAFQNAVLDGQDWEGPGGFWGGPDSIYIVYAYTGPPLPWADPTGGVLIGA